MRPYGTSHRERFLTIIPGMKRKGKTVAKADLPQKNCAACGRPFTWRRKWAASWDEVRYCSERCRRERPRDTMPSRD